MTSFVFIPTGGASTETAQFHGHFRTYLHLLPPVQFSIYFTLKTHLSCKPFKISIQNLLHTFIPPTLFTPTTLNQGNSGLYEYLWHVSNTSQFETSILHILVKERRNTHREQWNQNLSAPNLKLDM